MDGRFCRPKKARGCSPTKMLFKERLTLRDSRVRRGPHRARRLTELRARTVLVHAAVPTGSMSTAPMGH
jgi:hypothetical protein